MEAALTIRQHFSFGLVINLNKSSIVPAIFQDHCGHQQFIRISPVHNFHPAAEEIETKSDGDQKDSMFNFHIELNYGKSLMREIYG